MESPGPALVEEPVPRPLARVLRSAVLLLTAGDPRRVFDPVLHVGLPGGVRVDVAHDPAQDRGLRTDLVATSLGVVRRRAGADVPVLVWLTRPGVLSLHDDDVAWLGPVHDAAAEAGLAVPFVVVTRHGWWDPRSDVRREWKRIRQR